MTMQIGRWSRDLLLGHGPLILLGLLAVVWASAVLPTFRQSAPALDAAARIMADDRFRPGVLGDLLARAANAPQPSMVQPTFVRAQALIALRATEEVMRQKSSAEADWWSDYSEARIKAALSVEPGDPFLWLLLYSVVTTRGGFNPERLAYLSQSYLSGPNEGWVALRRNRLALAAFPFLDGATQQNVAAEFTKLVDADFIEDAALNLIGVGWPERDRLTLALRDVNDASKKALANRLSIEGITLQIPGVAYEDRPWRR